MKCKVSLYGIFALLISTPVFGLEFGKNQTYTQNFEWSTCETKHFTIFHYPQISHKTALISQMLEKTHDEMFDFLNVSPRKKPFFFFFEDHPDFHSNRIAPVSWGTGGFSEAFKNRFVLPYYTSPREMRHILQHEYTHVASFEIFYGGFWRSISLVRLMIYPIPLWIQEGLAEFSSDIWDGEDAAALRDIYLHGLIVPSENLLSFSHLEGYRVYLAYKQSQKMMIFITRKYGKNKVLELVKQFPQIWEQNIAMRKTFDIGSLKFDALFKEYLDEQYKKATEERNAPEKLGLMISPDFQFYRARNPFFFDGKIAFVSDGYGYDEIVIKDVKSGKQKRILKRKKNYFDSVGDSFAYYGNRLIFTAWKDGKHRLVFYENKKFLEIPIPFTEVRQIEALNDGSLLMAGDLHCQSDIFLWNEGKVSNITDDDDFEHSFTVIPGGQKIIYSCERRQELDLREMSLSSLKKTWLTDTPFDEKNPHLLKKHLYFISDRNSFSDIFRIEYSSSNFDEAENMTFIKTGVTDFAVSKDNEIAAVIQWEGARRIYIFDSQNAPADGSSAGIDDAFLKRGIDIEEAGLVLRRQPPEISDENFTAGIEMEKEKEKPPEPQEVRPYDFRKYKTRWSFDLVYPLAMFAFSEGDAEFYVLNYLQASDITGNHNASLYLQWLSATRDMNYSFSYLCKKWKTSAGFFTGGSRETRWSIPGEDEDADEVMKEDSRKDAFGLFFTRPLDKNNRLELMLARERNKDLLDWEENNYYETFENAYVLSLVRDFSIYRFMDIVKGRRANLSFAQSGKRLGGDFQYKSVYFEEQFFIPVLFPNHIFALRLLGLFSRGETPELFDITRWDMVRGVSGVPDETRLALGSAEYRFYVFPDIDYNVWWLIPPMYFKSLKGVVFYDAGEVFSESSGWGKENLRHSVGFGLRLNAMLFQSYPLFISFDRARTLRDKEYESYFRLGVNW
ncbi:MAG: hypothetical protein ABIH68_02945 [bacterium]